MEKLKIQSYPPIREQVYKYIRKMILNGEIGPGKRLIEAKLSQEIGISRTPIREALHKLEMENLIYSIPRVGYVVKDISIEEVEEICEIRMALETLAAIWASANMTPKEIDRLKQIILLTGKNIKSNEMEEVIKLDSEFHEIICRTSKSQRIEEISQSLRDHMLKFRIKALCVPNIACRSNEGHRKILYALKARDPKKIQEAVRFHLNRTKRDVTNLIKRNGQQTTADIHAAEVKDSRGNTIK
jgi:DNA-binding GntR family transcriptional regulator